MITQYRPAYYDNPRAAQLAGRSIDTKPIDVENGARYEEIDTGRVFCFDKEHKTWYEMPESGGGGSVSVEPITIEENGTTTAPDGVAYSPVTVNVQPNLQEKSVTITENGTTEITPDAGSDALSAVALTVDVPSSGSGAIPDWTQNDETAADYIKNRPGAYDIVQKTQTAAGAFVDLSDPGDLISFPAAITVEGQQVIVTVDGTDTAYTIPAPIDDGDNAAVYFGTTTYEEFMENPPENGYLFALLVPFPGINDGEGNTFGYAVAIGSYIGKTWTLSLGASTLVRIAAKYLDLDSIRQLPASTAADKDKFLRVDAEGNPVWQAVPNANGGSF